MSKRSVPSFIREIIACGFVHVENDDYEVDREDPDFDGFGSEDSLKLDPKNIKSVSIMRQSEFYFVFILKNKDGSSVFLELPINRWMITPAKKAAA